MPASTVPKADRSRFMPRSPDWSAVRPPRSERSPRARARRCSISSPATSSIWSVRCRRSDLAKLAVDQPAKIMVVGAGEMDGKVRLIAPTVEPNSQLGQVFISVDPSKHLLVNASGRAIIKTGESCGIAVPLTAILYGSAGTVVQVVRRQRVETRHVEVGLLSGGQVEIREGTVGRRRRGGARRRLAARRRSGQTDLTRPGSALGKLIARA